MSEIEQVYYESTGCVFPWLTILKTSLNESVGAASGSAESCNVTVAQVIPNQYKAMRIVMLTTAVLFLVIALFMLFAKIRLNYLNSKGSLKQACFRPDIFIWLNAVLFVVCNVSFSTDPASAGHKLNFYALSFLRFFLSLVIFNLLAGLIFSFQLTLSDLLNYSVTHLRSFVVGSISIHFITILLVLCFEITKIRDFVPRILWMLTLSTYFVITIITGVLFIHQVLKLESSSGQAKSLGQKQHIIMKLAMVSILLPCIGLSYFITIQFGRLRAGTGVPTETWFQGMRTMKDVRNQFLSSAVFNYLYSTVVELAFVLASLPICTASINRNRRNTAASVKASTVGNKLPEPAEKKV